MRYPLAFSLLITAATLASFNGVFIRTLGDMTDWQIVFWRHLLLGIVLCLGLTLSYRSGVISAFKKIGRLGIIGALAFGLSLLFMTMALHNSPIADVMFTLASIPSRKEAPSGVNLSPIVANLFNCWPSLSNWISKNFPGF